MALLILFHNAYIQITGIDFWQRKTSAVILPLWSTPISKKAYAEFFRIVPFYSNGTMKGLTADDFVFENIQFLELVHALMTSTTYVHERIWIVRSDLHRVLWRKKHLYTATHNDRFWTAMVSCPMSSVIFSLVHLFLFGCLVVFVGYFVGIESTNNGWREISSKLPPHSIHDDASRNQRHKTTNEKE
jgi:hypothetical protein